MTHEEREKEWKWKDKIQVWTSIFTFLAALGATLSGGWFVMTQLVMIPRDVVDLKQKVGVLFKEQGQMHDEQIEMKSDIKQILRAVKA